VTLAFDGRAAGDAPAVLADQRLVRGLDDYGQYAEVELAPDADPQELLRGLVQAGVRLSRFELTEPSLHRIFMDLVSHEGAGDA
jgi:ABC-2 type transport system ATP-binding protein